MFLQFFNIQKLRIGLTTILNQKYHYTSKEKIDVKLKSEIDMLHATTNLKY